MSALLRRCLITSRYAIIITPLPLLYAFLRAITLLILLPLPYVCRHARHVTMILFDDDAIIRLIIICYYASVLRYAMMPLPLVCFFMLLRAYDIRQQNVTSVSYVTLMPDASLSHNMRRHHARLPLMRYAAIFAMPCHAAYAYMLDAYNSHGLRHLRFSLLIISLIARCKLLLLWRHKMPRHAVICHGKALLMMFFAMLDITLPSFSLLRHAACHAPYATLSLLRCFAMIFRRFAFAAFRC